MKPHCQGFNCFHNKAQLGLLLIPFGEVLIASAEFLVEKLIDAGVETLGGHFTAESVLPEFLKPRIAQIGKGTQGKVVWIEFIHIRTMNANGN